MCVYRYLSSSSLDTPSLSLGDQSRGDGRGVLERERTQRLVSCTSVYSKRFVSSKILPGLNTLGPGKIDSKFRL